MSNSSYANLHRLSVFGYPPICTGTHFHHRNKTNHRLDRGPNQCNVQNPLIDPARQQQRRFTQQPTVCSSISSSSVSTAIDIFNLLVAVDLIGLQGTLAHVNHCQALIDPACQQQRRFTQQPTISSSIWS